MNVCHLEAWNDRCLGFAFKLVGGVGVVHVVGKERECGGDVAVLSGVLHIEAQVETVVEECNTGRVHVGTCDVDNCFLAKLTQE